MPKCPICRSDLQKPPEDVRDWFRCENCQTPLQVSARFGKVLFALSSMGVLVIYWTIEFFVLPYLPKILWHVPYSGTFLFYSLPLVLYAALVRLFWKTKFAHARVFDPYSSLNLSDDKTKLRGRTYTGSG
jgi:hypothetical protein